MKSEAARILEYTPMVCEAVRKAIRELNPDKDFEIGMTLIQSAVVSIICETSQAKDDKSTLELFSELLPELLANKRKEMAYS